MIITIKIRTPYPRSLVTLLQRINQWLKHCPNGRMIGWTTEDEVGDE